MSSESDFRKGISRKRTEKQICNHARTRRDQAVQEHSEKRNLIEYPGEVCNRKLTGKQRYGKSVNFVVGTDRSYDRPIERKTHHERHHNKHQIEKRLHKRFAQNTFFSVPIRRIAFGIDFE